MLKLIKVLILLAVLFLGIILALHNAQSVDVNYLLGHAKLSLILLIWIALVVGFAIGLGLSLSRSVGMRGRLRKMRRRVHKLEAENKKLSNPALRDV